MRRDREWVVVEVSPNMRRGISAHPSRQQAERAIQGKTQHTDLRYEVEESMRHSPSPDPPDRP